MCAVIIETCTTVIIIQKNFLLTNFFFCKRNYVRGTGIQAKICYKYSAMIQKNNASIRHHQLKRWKKHFLDHRAVARGHKTSLIFAILLSFSSVKDWPFWLVNWKLNKNCHLKIFLKTHCIISLLIPFEEDVCTFLIFSYSFIDQQLLLKQFCLNRLSFWYSLLTSKANPAQRGRTGCAG